MSKNKQPAKAPKTIEPTLSNHVWITVNGSKTTIATIHVYCPWLPKEVQASITLDLNRVLFQLMESAKNILLPDLPKE